MDIGTLRIHGICLAILVNNQLIQVKVVTPTYAKTSIQLHTKALLTRYTTIQTQ